MKDYIIYTIRGNYVVSATSYATAIVRAYTDYAVLEENIIVIAIN